MLSAMKTFFTSSQFAFQLLQMSSTFSNTKNENFFFTPSKLNSSWQKNDIGVEKGNVIIGDSEWHLEQLKR